MAERKLTKPQLELLKTIADGGKSVSGTYRPALQLVTKGFAEWRRGKYSDPLFITDAGRRALSEGGE